MHRWFLPALLAFTFIAASAPDASARDIPRDPEDYAADMTRWHLIHKRDRKALQSVTRQFPTIPAAFSIGKSALTTEQRFERANEDHGYITSTAFGATLAAVLFSKGKYAVSKSAGKQREARRQQTLTIAEAMLDHLRNKRSGDFQDEAWASFCRHVERRAEISLMRGEYAQVVRDLQRAHPGLSELSAAADKKAVQAALKPLDSRTKETVRHLISAVLRSRGDVPLVRDGNAQSNLSWALIAAKSGEFDSPELMADALAAQPPLRAEYVQFVLKAAMDDSFTSAWGWQHVQRVTTRMHKQATETAKDHKRWEKEEKPSRMQPENSCE